MAGACDSRDVTVRPGTPDTMDGDACVACGAAIDRSTAYLDDEGRPLYHGCFEAGEVVEMERRAASSEDGDGWSGGGSFDGPF